MSWSVEFLDSSRLVVHHGKGWSVRAWPSLTVLEEAAGSVLVEQASGRRAIHDGGQWSVDGSLLPADISRFCWLSPDSFAAVTGEPGDSIRVTRLPVPEEGSTAFIFGTPVSGTQALRRLTLSTGEDEVLVRPAPRERIIGVAAGPAGAVDYEVSYGPVPGFEPGRNRLRRILPDGSDVDPCPQLVGATSLPLVSPSGRELIRYSRITSFFPAWWQLCDKQGHPIFSTSRRQDTAPARFSADGTQVAVPVESGLSSSVAIISLDIPSEPTMLALPGTARSVACHEDGTVVALVRSLDGSIVLLDTRKPDDPLLELRGPRRPEVQFQAWTYRSGPDELEGILARPVNVQGPLPLLVDVHGGPSPGLTAGETDVARWCKYGYLAFAPEFRTSGALGVEAMVAGERDETDGLTDVDDVIAGIRSLVSAGLVDPDRVYLFGHSYGGILVNRLARTPIARAAVSWEGGSDRSLEYMVGGGNPISYELLGGHPWERPDAYRRQSDLEAADQIHMPLLLIAGDEDPSESIALYTALRARGRDVELVIYAGEGHTMEREENDVDLEERAIAWFRSHTTP